MHEFHTERTARLLDAAVERFGEGALDVVASAGVDRAGLYEWHVRRMAAMVDALTARFGPDALEVLVEAEVADRVAEGARLAAEAGNTSLESLAHVFTGGRPERVAARNDREIVVRTSGCLAARAGIALGRTDLIHRFHCGTDPALAEGFNPALGCEVRCTVMEGHAFCEHRLFEK